MIPVQSILNNSQFELPVAVPKKPLHPTSPEQLPDDVGLLKAMLWEVLQSHDELSQQVAWLKRVLWGQKSEKLVSPEQMALFVEVQKRLGIGSHEHGDEDHELVEPSSNDGDKQAKPEANKPARMPAGRAKTRRGGKRDKPRGRFLGGTVPEGTPVETTHICLDGAACPVRSGAHPARRRFAQAGRVPAGPLLRAGDRSPDGHLPRAPPR